MQKVIKCHIKGNLTKYWGWCFEQQKYRRHARTMYHNLINANLPSTQYKGLLVCSQLLTCTGNRFMRSASAIVFLGLMTYQPIKLSELW